MFKFTIREMLFVTAIVGLSLGWWLDHSILAAGRDEARGDARMIRNLTMPTRTMCGSEFASLQMLREKYDTPDVEANPFVNPDRSASVSE